jgi:hypothetical protein
VQGWQATERDGVERFARAAAEEGHGLISWNEVGA